MYLLYRNTLTELNHKLYKGKTTGTRRARGHGGEHPELAGHLHQQVPGHQQRREYIILIHILYDPICIFVSTILCRIIPQVPYQKLLICSRVYKIL